MNTLKLRQFALLATFAALTACEQSAAPTPVAEQAPVAEAATLAEAAPAPSTALAGQNALLSADPGSANCETGTDVELSWDVSSRPEIANVEVWVGAEPTLFAAGGATGAQKSGPWVKPGMSFILRNKADSAELDRVTIAGPACPPEAAETTASEAPVQQ